MAAVRPEREDVLSLVREPLVDGDARGDRRPRPDGPLPAERPALEVRAVEPVERVAERGRDLGVTNLYGVPVALRRPFEKPFESRP